MRDQYHPKLRTKHSKSRNSTISQQSDQIQSKGDVTMEESNNLKQFNNNNNERKGGFRGKRVRQTGAKVEPQVKVVMTPGLSVFYSNLGIGNKHKLSVSHYEMQLMPEWTSTTTIPYNSWANQTMQDRDVLALGGEKFRVKVRAAAEQALCNVTDVATTTVDVLTNDFYHYLYNARTLYSLLCTLHRCQQCVNVMDEDGMRLAAVLNNHSEATRSVGWSSTSYATEVAMNNYQSLATRQGLTFSMPISNGVWGDAIVAPIIENSRLPKGWREWIEAKFKSFHVVQPSDYSATPRIVAFWPTASYVSSDSSSNAQLNYFTGYYDRDASTGRYQDGSPTTAQLTAFIDAISAQQGRILASDKYVGAMLTALQCEFSDTDFNRDIRKETMPMNDSFDVRPFIDSTSTAFYQFYDSSGSVYYKATSRRVYSGSTTRFESVYIERDPNVKYYSDPFGKSSDNLEGAANMIYDSQVELKEADYCLCTRLVLPLNMSIIVGNASDAYFRWSLPLNQISGYLTNSIGGFATTANIMTAEMELASMFTQGMGIVGRLRHQAAGSGTAVGLLDTYQSVAFLDLKDYLVDNRTAHGWSNSYADTLSLG